MQLSQEVPLVGGPQLVTPLLLVSVSHRRYPVEAMATRKPFGRPK